MLLKRFYINLVIRLLLILITMVFQAFALKNLIEAQLLFTFIVLSGILLLQVLLLFRYVRKTNRLLTKLVLSVANLDFSQTLSKTNNSHRELKDALNKLIGQYQSIYMEKESQNFLIHHLVQVIPAGILLIDQNDQILLSNKAVRGFIDVKALNTMEEIRKREPGLYQKIQKPATAGTFIHEMLQGGELKKLSVSVTEFMLLKKNHRIILVQDISKEVEAGEMDAMQRLLRILTHEIMNSLTPVHTLTETIAMLMTDEDGRPKKQDKLSQQNFNDILESVLAIQERTGGLDHFVSRFRTLTRMPETLDKITVPVKVLLDSVLKIMHSQLANVHLELEVSPEDLEIIADSVLMEQVLINLVTNSLTAMSSTEHPELTLKAFEENSHTVIRVQDNGSGIPQDKLGDIFMPFYSTKPEASGVGLSFVKQVLRLHNATIQVHSKVNQGSIFSIHFEADH